ncbi:MAG: hypothetical protein IJ649_10640 [Oscillospiraceae bacterium]|nr:hypothetical protein [Oscillospiraceae bacterium]
MFEKRVDIFKKRDKETWLKIKEALKEAGLPGVKSGHYLQETVMGGGCGAKLDPRNFGAKGVIDRDIYWVKVIADDEEKAREILRQNGIVTEVQDDVLLDAALRKKPKEDYFGR